MAEKQKKMFEKTLFPPLPRHHRFAGLQHLVRALVRARFRDDDISTKYILCIYIRAVTMVDRERCIDMRR